MVLAEQRARSSTSSLPRGFPSSRDAAAGSSALISPQAGRETFCRQPLSFIRSITRENGASGGQGDAGGGDGALQPVCRGSWHGSFSWKGGQSQPGAGSWHPHCSQLWSCELGEAAGCIIPICKEFFPMSSLDLPCSTQTWYCSEVEY